MKNLIFKNDLFYLVDEIGTTKGQTRSVSGYNATTISKTNMPHQYFNKKIVIYGRNTCPYCIGILDYLSKNPLLYKKVVFIEIDTEPLNYLSKTNILLLLKPSIKTHTTVPIVFDKNVFIGGADASKIYFDSL